MEVALVVCGGTNEVDDDDDGECSFSVVCVAL